MAQDIETTLTEQYFFAPASIEYHLAKNEVFTLCGDYIDNSRPKRRRDDWRITNEKPQGRASILCPRCQRTLTGESEPEIMRHVPHHHDMYCPP